MGRRVSTPAVPPGAAAPVTRTVAATLVAALVLAGCGGSPGRADRTTTTRPRTTTTTTTGAPATTAAPAAVSAWTTYDQDPARDGVDTSGASFTPARPAWTSSTLDGSLFGQPLVDGGRVYVATENDTVYALAADTGAVVWSTHVGTPFRPSTVPGLCGDITPTIGITSTPVIDPARNELFAVAAEQVPGNAAHHLVGLNLATGATMLDEVVDQPGYDPAHELQRTSLALTDGRVIIASGGNYGDCDPYHGLVVSAPEGGSAPTTFVVADLRGDSEGAVWMGGGAPAIDSSGNVWVSTGNSAYESSSDPYDNSDGVLELTPTMQLLQAFAPTTWPSDNASDLDLSTPPVLLPGGLVFALGKSSTGFLLDQAHLGGVGGELASAPECFGHGAAAHVGPVVYTGCAHGVSAVRVSGSPAGLTTLWTSSTGGGGSPIVAGGGVWAVGDGNLTELNPATGAVEQQFAVGASDSSFPSPSAAEGLILAPSGDTVHAFVGPAGPR